MSEGEWSDEEDEKRAKEREDAKKSKKDLKLGKRKKREDDDMHDFFHGDAFEEVPEENLDNGYSSMDSDDMAETRALAKLMLRKKARTEIMESTYNRYSNFDDPAVLPDWFVQDEKKHYKPNIPITKAQA